MISQEEIDESCRVCGKTVRLLDGLEWDGQESVVCHLCHIEELQKEVEAARAENERLREALDGYTTCRHVGIACAAECGSMAKEALQPKGDLK